MALLLDRHPDITVTSMVVKVAVRNEGSEKKVMTLLLDRSHHRHRGGGLADSSAVLGEKR
jgi:hypothetical protein